MARASRHLGAAAIMVGGSALLVVVLATLNKEPPEKQDKEASEALGFVVEAAAPPPPKPVKRKPRKTSKRSKAPPTPVLGASLSGLDLGLDAGGDAGLDLSDSLLGDTSNVVMTEDAVDQIPQPLSRVAPKVPSRIRQRGTTGRVVLKLLVGDNGAVQDVRVLESEPRGVFDSFAIDAVRQWTFSPATYNGLPVKTWAVQALPFRFE